MSNAKHVDRVRLTRKARQEMEKGRREIKAGIVQYERHIREWRGSPDVKLRAFTNVAVGMNRQARRLVGLFDRALRAGELRELDARVMDRLQISLVAHEVALREEDRAGDQQTNS